MRTSEAPGLESLIQQFLTEPDAVAAAGTLSEIAEHHVQPLLERIVRVKLGGSPAFIQDMEDVVSEALLGVLSCLEDWKAGTREPVHQLASYAATTAYHACQQYFRDRFPNRHRLKSKIRYILKPDRGFDLWEAGNHEWYCGRTGWRNRTAVAPVETGLAPSMPLERLVGAVVDAGNAPIELDTLVDHVARMTGVSDHPVDFEKVCHVVPDRTEAPAESPEAWRVWAEQVWAEIVQLPLPQRVALLLNLRVEDEAGPLSLFSLTGVASMQGIAGALEMTPEELGRLWNRIPLPDLELASRLNLTRQQVINLRLSARRRLERRMSEAISAIRRHQI